MKYTILLCLVKLLTSFHQHYPPGTQEIYSNFPSRNLMMEKGKESEFPEGRGGGKGEPGVPPTFHNKYDFRLYCMPLTIKPPLSNDIYAGKDNRYNESDVDQDLLKRIKENLEKYETLKYLENDQVSILDKLRKLEESGVKPPNLKAGGLTKDWDFV
jgi:hypothetical protein